MYFHMLEGESGSIGVFGEDARERGMITMSVTGMGDFNSWNGPGGNTDTGPTGSPVCNENYGEFRCHEDCGGCQAELCNQVTCKDSIAQVLDVMTWMMDNFCVDLGKIWATGCSNGGIFTFGLAGDARTAGYIAGIMPMVGLPLYGYSNGPASPMHLFGMWGANDPLVEPFAGDDPDWPDRSPGRGGMYFTTADAVTKHWKQDGNCGEKRTRPMKSDMFEQCW